MQVTSPKKKEPESIEPESIEPESIEPESIACYIDGSKTEHSTGYGLITTTNNNRTRLTVKLPDYCSHNALNALSEPNSVRATWIAGHEGHWGNEKADELQVTT